MRKRGEGIDRKWCAMLKEIDSMIKLLVYRTEL